MKETYFQVKYSGLDLKYSHWHNTKGDKMVGLKRGQVNDTSQLPIPIASSHFKIRVQISHVKWTKRGLHKLWWLHVRFFFLIYCRRFKFHNVKNEFEEKNENQQNVPKNESTWIYPNQPQKNLDDGNISESYKMSFKMTQKILKENQLDYQYPTTTNSSILRKRWK